MKKQIKRQIYLLSKRHMKPIEVVQYDYGVQLVFEVMDIDLDALALYATLFVRKPSGKFVFQEDNISITGNTVTINLENQALTEPGKAFFQIKFKANKTDLSTYSGMLTVEKSLEDSGAEESKTVIAAFDKLTDEEIAKIEEATQTQIDLMKAEVEAKGETVLATIPDEYTEMYNRVNTLFNSVANAIKGTVSGSVVRVDDVSPVEHSPTLKVHGRNLIAYPHDNTTKTQNGLTFTDNGDGSVTVVGTATAVTYYDLCKFSSRFFTKGDRYFNAMSNAVTFEGYAIKDCSIQQREGGNTFCHLVITEGQTINKTYYPQIEKGNTATEYTPYIDPSTVTVTADGVNYTPEADGTVSGIPSTALSGGISTDNEGITIECEYNKDTGKVIEKLTNAVVALGGVV